MNERLATVLALVRAGVCRKPQLAAKTGLSMRAMKDVLRSLADTGHVMSVKTDAHDWSWVPAESTAALRAAVAAKVRQNTARLAQAAWQRKKAQRPVPVRRGHGEEVDQAVVQHYRPIKKTAPASVFELAQFQTSNANEVTR